MSAKHKQPTKRAKAAPRRLRTPWRADLDFAEKVRLAKRALIDAKNNRTRAAKLLGITRAGLSNFLNRHTEALGLDDVIDCPKCGARIKIPDAKREAAPSPAVPVAVAVVPEPKPAIEPKPQ